MSNKELARIRNLVHKVSASHAPEAEPRKTVRLKTIYSVSAILALALCACAKPKQNTPDAPHISVSQRLAPCHSPLLSYERPGDNCEAPKP